MAMRRTLSVGAILLLTGGLPLLLPTAANACSCASSATPEEAVSVSSTVFLGTPTEKTSDGFEDTYLFDVSRGYKGDLASVTSVGTLANGNGCGTSYVLGTEQLMFVSAPYDVDAEHEGHSCGRLPNPGSTSKRRARPCPAPVTPRGPAELRPLVCPPTDRRSSAEAPRWHCSRCSVGSDGGGDGHSESTGTVPRPSEPRQPRSAARQVSVKIRPTGDLRE